MKKFLTLFAMAVSFAACNNGTDGTDSDDSATVTTTPTTVTTDSSTMAPMTSDTSMGAGSDTMNMSTDSTRR